MLPTTTQAGGNTDELYKEDGRRKMAEALVELHPDVAKVSWKWHRWQHQVDYSSFKKNLLKLKPGIVVSEGINNFGMVLKIDPSKLEKKSKAQESLFDGQKSLLDGII